MFKGVVLGIDIFLELSGPLSRVYKDPASAMDRAFTTYQPLVPPL